MITTLVVISVLVLDRFVASPFLRSWERISSEKTALVGELENATMLFERERQARRRWHRMRRSQLRQEGSEAEGQVLHALREWSHKHRLSLSSVKPEHGRPREGEELQEIGFQLSGTGPMRAAVGFLWEVQASDLPLKISELQLASAREGRDEVSLQLRMSTIYVSPGHEGDYVAGVEEVQR
jgi:hypothetical protein